jgi:hypothetical protein
LVLNETTAGEEKEKKEKGTGASKNREGRMGAEKADIALCGSFGVINYDVRFSAPPSPHPRGTTRMAASGLPPE